MCEFVDPIELMWGDKNTVMCLDDSILGSWTECTRERVDLAILKREEIRVEAGIYVNQLVR